MKPSVSGRNLTPTSTAFESSLAGTSGVAPLLQIEQGVGRGPTVTERVGPLTSRLQLSSIARARIVRGPSGDGSETTQLHDDVPVARFHVTPLSTDASTQATWPPPASVTVPVIVTGVATGIS